MPATRSLFSRTLAPPFSLSSPESRLLKFHTISVCTSSTVRAAIRADRDRRANLRAHKPPTIFAPGCTELEDRLWLCAARREEGVEVEGGRGGGGGGGGDGGGGGREAELFTVAEARRSVEKERHRATVWWNSATGDREDAQGGCETVCSLNYSLNSHLSKRGFR